MLFPAGSGVTSAPSPLHGCGFVPLFALEIRREGVQPLSLCFSRCCWRGGMAQSCPYPSLPFPVGILPPCLGTLGSWSVVGWAAASTEALGFRSVFPERIRPRMWALHGQRKGGLWRPQSRWLLANLKTVAEPCSVGEPAAIPFLRALGARR